MRQRITRVDPLGAARLAALLHFLIGLMILPFLYFAFVLTPTGIGFSAAMVLLVPVLLGGFAFALASVGCLLFNWLAGRYGGLEIEMAESQF